MNKIKNNLKGNYSIIPNELINDISISDRARFLFCYMASKPDDWKFYNKALSKELGYSVDTLRKYIKELVESGWISRQDQKKVDGKFAAVDYTIHAVRISPYRKNTDTGKNRHGKTTTHTNKDFNKERLNTNKENFNKRKTKFKAQLKEFKEYGPKVLSSFFDYWTEPNKSGTKMRFELERTWDLNLRLKRWTNNSWNKPKNSEPSTFVPSTTAHFR